MCKVHIIQKHGCLKDGHSLYPTLVVENFLSLKWKLVVDDTLFIEQ